MENLPLTELLKARKLIEQLESFNTSPEFCKYVEEIEATLDRAISLVESPFGEGSTNVDPVTSQHKRESSKRRKTLPTWQEQVRVLPGSSKDRPPEDGFNWRKYGHKEILNSTYPRCYYRCTFKYTHSCPATKQAQRFDKDPTVFNVVYKGEHVCAQRAISAPPAQQSSLYFFDGGAALNVITQELMSSPSFSSSRTPVSRLREIPAVGHFPVNSAPPFVSFSGIGGTHFTPDESFHGSNHAGVWESDMGDLLGATSATSSHVMGYDSLLENGFDQSLFP